jgi:hypothetical protein
MPSITTHDDGGCRSHRRGERAHDLATSAITRGMHDAALRVCCFLAQLQRSVRLAIEAGAIVQQGLDCAGSRCGDAMGDIGIAEPRSGGERVGEMTCRVILRPDRGGDAALRPGARSFGL